MAKISVRRLYNQRLEGTKFHTPGDAVSWLVVVHAQDYAGAKWALKLRTEGVTDDDIEQAFTDGTILRTHLMRPTWHFVTRQTLRKDAVVIETCYFSPPTVAEYDLLNAAQQRFREYSGVAWIGNG